MRWPGGPSSRLAAARAGPLDSFSAETRALSPPPPPPPAPLVAESVVVDDVRLELAEPYGATGKFQLKIQADVTLQQPDFGIKPYKALGGALKVKPEVRVSVRVLKS